MKISKLQNREINFLGAAIQFQKIRNEVGAYQLSNPDTFGPLALLDNKTLEQYVDGIRGTGK